MNNISKANLNLFKYAIKNYMDDIIIENYIGLKYVVGLEFIKSSLIKFLDACGKRGAICKYNIICNENNELICCVQIFKEKREHDFVIRLKIFIEKGIIMGSQVKFENT